MRGGVVVKVFLISYSGIWKYRDKTAFWGNNYLKPRRCKKKTDQQILFCYGEIFFQRWRHSENFLILHWILDFNDSPLSPVLKYVSSYEASREKVVILGEFQGFADVGPGLSYNKSNKLNAGVVFRCSMVIPFQEKILNKKYSFSRRKFIFKI